jgi:hypothetical protein
VDASPFSSTLPALDSTFLIWAGAGGFQELDLDVEATTITRGNHIYFTDTIDAPLDDIVLVDSLFRDAKPSWFNSLTWPPVDPSNPVYEYEIIPAGYRYMNAGSDPP